MCADKTRQMAIAEGANMKAKHEIIVEKLGILDSRISSLTELVDSFKGPIPPVNCDTEKQASGLSLDEFLEDAGPGRIVYCITHIEDITQQLKSIVLCPEATGPQ